MKPALHGIYGITDDALLGPQALLPDVEQALKGGIALLQYRSKSLAVAAKKEVARELLALCRSHSVPLIINDDMQLCAEIGADGVHLGQSDGDCSAARELLGENAIIGVTCHASIDKARAAAAAGADYVAFGRFFPSQTKPDASPADIELLAQARREITIPIVAIGGINAENGASLIAAGADMLAVIHSLFGTNKNTTSARPVEANAIALSALFA